MTSVKDIAQEALNTGLLKRNQENRLYELFERKQADEADMRAADELINALLDGRITREWTQPLEWQPIGW
jgi:hypothetical protein